MRAKLRAWHKVQLVTRWNRAAGRAVLHVHGIAAAATTVTGLDGVMARRVTVGLGRPSSSSETGLSRSVCSAKLPGRRRRRGRGAAAAGRAADRAAEPPPPGPRTPAPTEPTPPNPGPDLDPARP